MYCVHETLHLLRYWKNCLRSLFYLLLCFFLLFYGQGNCKLLIYGKLWRKFSPSFSWDQNYCFVQLSLKNLRERFRCLPSDLPLPSWQLIFLWCLKVSRHNLWLLPLVLPSSIADKGLAMLLLQVSFKWVWVAIWLQHGRLKKHRS